MVNLAVKVGNLTLKIHLSLPLAPMDWSRSGRAGSVGLCGIAQRALHSLAAICLEWLKPQLGC